MASMETLDMQAGPQANRCNICSLLRLHTESVFSHPLPRLPAAQHGVPARRWQLRLLLLTRDCLQAPADCQFTGKGHAVHDQHLGLQHAMQDTNPSATMFAENWRGQSASHCKEV